MKKYLSLILALTAVMALALTACSSGSSGGSSGGDSSGGTLVVGTEAGFAPYEYMKGDEVVGVDMDICQAIADELGMELVIKNMDFDGALTSVQSGKLDMVAAGVSVTDEREEVMDFTHAYVDSTEVVVVNEETMAVTPSAEGLSGSDLDGKIVAVQQGNIADGWVSSTDNCNAAEIKRYTKFAQAAADLKNNKVDCIVMDQKPAEELVASNEGLVILDGVLFEDNYAIAVKKGNTELLDQINPIIDKLIEEGKIDEFIANHTNSGN